MYLAEIIVYLADWPEVALDIDFSNPESDVSSNKITDSCVSKDDEGKSEHK